MPVIKWLGGKGSGHKTAWGRRTIGGENMDDTNAALKLTGLLCLGILSSPIPMTFFSSVQKTLTH